MMLHSKSIGQKIALARKNKNLSQAELAVQVSISPQAVGKWERGESLPDIPTLNKIAEILGVDLNYFSDIFQDKSTEMKSHRNSGNGVKNVGRQWDMSQGNWVDADFSGLKNLDEKFSASNMKNCKFLNSDLSGLRLEKNNIEACDFSNSNLRNSRIQSSNLLSNRFNHCSFINTEFAKNNISNCDFSEANLSGAGFVSGYFESNKVINAVWKFTSFKECGISNIVFEGRIEDCHFEACAFYGVKFKNAIILNSFFKYNRRFKKVEFIDCQVDRLTYAFLKSNMANLDGICVIES